MGIDLRGFAAGKNPLCLLSVEDIEKHSKQIQ